MAIAKDLPVVHTDFIQKCPLCSRMNRMVVLGVYKLGDKVSRHPDIGYSFCNCKCIFYTDYSNIKVKTHSGFQYYEKPLEELKNVFEMSPNGKVLTFHMPDPFFCDWGQDPYTFEHWNPRFNHILFDMDQFCEDAKEVGFEVISARHEFDVQSEYPKTMEIILKKP